MAITIFPSLMQADLLNLERVIRQFEGGCDGFHLDIMDNHYVSNLSFGIDVVNSIACITSRCLQLHLMVEDPLAIIARCHLRSDDIIIFHTNMIIEEVIKHIQQQGLKVFIALNPCEPLSVIEKVAFFVDGIMLMGVNPGFAGQPFLEETFNRLERLVLFKKMHNLSFICAVDGGITVEILKKLILKGCQSVAVSSVIFSSSHPYQTLETLYNVASEALKRSN